MNETSSATVFYREYAPHQYLRRFVCCYWSWQTSETVSAQPYCVLPDGCVDLLFGDACPVEGKIVGAMTTATTITLQPNKRFFGVRFHPGGASAFLKLPVSEITDAQLRLDEIWRNDKTFLTDVTIAQSVARQIEVVETFLLKRLSGNAFVKSKAAVAVALLTAGNGNRSITAVSRALGVSRQHLTRTFTAAVGLNPKTFARIIRLQAALKQMRAAPNSNWTEFALENGYYDQAHLISEFKNLTGSTPTKLETQLLNNSVY